MDCLRLLRVPCARGQDGKPRKKVPNGFYSWHSSYSSVVGWLFTACLGLGWDQRTTKHPVQMAWLLGAPRYTRIWFLRGLADSDGNVHFQHRWVDIATSPNTVFVKNLVESLGFHTNVRVHRGYGYVSISAADAARIQIFNPELQTYRRLVLEKLVAAETFHKNWPDWLGTKVDSLIRAGLTERRICESILEEYNVYLRMRTIKARRKKLDLLGAVTRRAIRYPRRFETRTDWFSGPDPPSPLPRRLSNPPVSLMVKEPSLSSPNHASVAQPG